MHLSIAIIPLFSADHCNCIFTPLHKICCKFQIDIKDHKNLFYLILRHSPHHTPRPLPAASLLHLNLKFRFSRNLDIIQYFTNQEKCFKL